MTDWVMTPSSVGTSGQLYSVVSRTQMTRDRAEEYVDYLNTHDVLAKSDLKASDIAQGTISMPTPPETGYIGHDVNQGYETFHDNGDQAIRWWLGDTKARKLFRVMWKDQVEVFVGLNLNGAELTPIPPEATVEDVQNFAAEPITWK